MLGKTLILGLISAGAAGAIVYYGTAPQGIEALEVHPHGEKTVHSSVQKALKNNDSEGKTRKSIAPRLPTVRKTDDDDGRKKLAEGHTLPKGPDVEAPNSDDEPKKQSRWLDQYLKKNDADKSKGSKSEVNENADKDAPKDDTKKGGSDSAVNGYSVVERAAIDDIEPDAAAEKLPQEKPKSNRVIDTRVYRIEDGVLVEVTRDISEDNTAQDVTDIDDAALMEEAREASELADAMIAENMAENASDMDDRLPHKFTHDMTDMANDSTPLLSTVMREAAAIKKSELRDQAYFEITEYALSEGRYDSARMAHDMIEQDELSYTAKSRIAVAFAQNGMPTKAFKVIGEVDEAELRDFMRLQVIEALISPQNLPETWQEQHGPKGHINTH